ncbi:MAG: hypothetical protein RL291_953 [Pseudomonadota bacterium]
MIVQRRTILAGLGAFGTSLALPTVALGHGYKRGTIEIAHPWCPDTFVEGTQDVIVGMDIKSKAARGDRLLRAESAVAASVEIRDQQGGVLSSLPIPGMSTVSLGRSGAHIRLIGLRKTLIVYDTLPMTLVFERGGRIAVDILVEEPIEAKS